MVEMVESLYEMADLLLLSPGGVFFLKLKASSISSFFVNLIFLVNFDILIHRLIYLKT